MALFGCCRSGKPSYRKVFLLGGFFFGLYRERSPLPALAFALAPSRSSRLTVRFGKSGRAVKMYTSKQMQLSLMQGCSAATSPRHACCKLRRIDYGSLVPLSPRKPVRRHDHAWLSLSNLSLLLERNGSTLLSQAKSTKLLGPVRNGIDFDCRK